MPWGEILQGIGAGVAATGGTFESIGNMKAKNKSRKKLIDGLQQAYNTSKNEFTLGSQDTQGNQLNFNKQRGWGFNLSNPGRAEVINANRQAYLANAMSGKLPSAYRNQQTAADFKAIQQQARANQSAANRMALRGNGNVGQINRSFGQYGSSALQNAMLNNIRNGQIAQQNAMNTYINNANNAKNLTAQTMQNLLNIQNGPATQQLGLNTNMLPAIAQANATPKQTNLAMFGNILQGLGQGIGSFGSGMDMSNRLNKISLQNQAYNDKYLSLIQQLINKGGN